MSNTLEASCQSLVGPPQTQSQKSMPQTTLGDWLKRKQTQAALPSASPRAVIPRDTPINDTAEMRPVGTDEDRVTAGSHDPRSSKTPHTSGHTFANRIPQLPPNVTIEPCQDRYLQSYRRMNALLLPIPYRDDFYKETMQDPVIASVTRLALWHEKPSSKTSASVTEAKLVAAIRCRILASPPDNPYEKVPVLYISTITTLAPFRGHSLASHLLADVIRTGIEDYEVKAIMGHVWEENDEGMAWYKKRGFRVVAHEPEYYRRLAPKTAAFVIRRDVGPGDLLQSVLPMESLRRREGG